MGCPSGKRRYTGPKQADEVLSRIWRSRWHGPGKLPCRSYGCELCGGWHLTSVPLIEYQEQLAWEARHA